MPSVNDPLSAAREDFYARRRSDRLPFVVNDTVAVISATADGSHGAVIFVEGVDPLEYLVESGNGSGDMVVLASQLQLAPESQELP